MFDFTSGAYDRQGAGEPAKIVADGVCGEAFLTTLLAYALHVHTPLVALAPVDIAEGATKFARHVFSHC